MSDDKKIETSKLGEDQQEKVDPGAHVDPVPDPGGTRVFDSPDAPPPDGSTKALGDQPAATPGDIASTRMVGDYQAPPADSGGTRVFEQDKDLAVYKSPLPDRLRVILPDKSEVSFTNFRPYLIVGRRTTTNKGSVDIDLGQIDKGVNGVSRMHAMIIPNDRGLTLKDLSSTNGTFLNGQKLQPQLAYPIKNGDYIKFGNLKMQVYLERDS